MEKDAAEPVKQASESPKSPKADGHDSPRSGHGSVSPGHLSGQATPEKATAAPVASTAAPPPKQVTSPPRSPWDSSEESVTPVRSQPRTPPPTATQHAWRGGDSQQLATLHSDAEKVTSRPGTRSTSRESRSSPPQEPKPAPPKEAPAVKSVPRATPKTEGGEAPKPDVAQGAEAGGESLGPGEDDVIPIMALPDDRLGWFRMWVLCSVACMVLIIPFGLTVLSYTATSRLRKPFSCRGYECFTYSKPTTRRTTTTTAMPLIYYDDRSGRSSQCLLTHYSALKDLALDGPVRPAATASSPKPELFRRVFCVFDTENIPSAWRNYWDIFPFDLCTDIIVNSIYLDKTARLRLKRPTRINGRLGRPFSWPFPHHRGIRTNVYITYGGSRADSPSIGSVVSLSFLNQLRQFVAAGNYTGFNIDWDHPADRCSAATVTRLRIFLRFLRQTDNAVFTIPPDLSVVKRIWSRLSYTKQLIQVQYVIVATHRLRARGLVCCTGGQNEAAMVYWAIRYFLGLRFYQRLAYSIALGADIHFGKFKELWAKGELVSSFYDRAQHTKKLSYKDVCNLSVVDRTDQCVLSVIGRNSSGYKLATFSGTEQLDNRLARSYVYEMAQHPVVVYDMELDDYGGACGNTKWPLMRALTNPVNRSLRNT